MTMMKLGGMRLQSILSKILGLSLILSVSGAALAHDVPPSTAMLDIGRRVIDIELQLPLSELGAALAPPLAPSPEIEDYIRDNLRIHDRNGRAYRLRIESLGMRRTNNANWTSNDWYIVRAALEAPPGALTEVFALDYSVILERVVSHNALIYVRRDIRNGLLGDEPMPIGLMGFGHTHLDVDGSNGSWWRGFTHLFSLGMQHIAEGTDHLLFLLVLLLPAPLIASAGRWRGRKSTAASVWTIVKIVSGFTLAHSLTLALASAGWFSVPSRPIEVLIAVSIIASSIHAWRPIFSGREIWIAFAFGLVHGLAFASVLAGLSFDGWTLVLSLLGFNLGIETMQLLAIAAVLPPLILLSATRGFAAVRIAGATFAALCSLGWTAERGFQVTNPLEPLVRWLAAPPTGLVVSLCLVSFVCVTLLLRASRNHRRHSATLVATLREPVM